MPKKPLSVTLEEDNILWLRGQTAAGKQRSLSEALDVLVTSARQAGYGTTPRSVVGTIDIASSDPALLRADADVRARVKASIAQPFPGAVKAGRGKRKARQ
ncbi:MAG: hypothetical protein EPO35_02710 [Acidobacteria bacterium]|nr:MAG: hypothetical protein EPO35_02710 [Acidobacteriota bacterium]